MTIYKVTYVKVNFDKKFCGSWDYLDTVTKMFTTREKAEEFVANEEKEYVPTWDSYEVVKGANKGTIEEVEID